jgi:hypothetical protein
MSILQPHPVPTPILRTRLYIAQHIAQFLAPPMLPIKTCGQPYRRLLSQPGSSRGEV